MTHQHAAISELYLILLILRSFNTVYLVFLHFSFYRLSRSIVANNVGKLNIY